MKSSQRQDQMKEYIHVANRVSVSELSRRWNITEETVRRDLDKLESQGSVTRTHGGAVWSGNTEAGGEQFLRRQMSNAAEKAAIAVKAAEVIRNFETIVADASSTVLETLKAVADDGRLSVVTNSSKICDGSFEPAYTLISTGGTYNWKSLSFQGESTIDTLKRYHVDLAVLSCKALDITRGIMDSYESEAVVKQVMVRQAREVAILADHTKFDNIALLKLMGLDSISYIVTDRKPSEIWVQFCEEHAITLVY